MEDKKEIMKNKGKLRGRKEWIGDDLTWKERKMQWRLREIGEEEGRKGKRVRVSYGRIEIEGKMWFWDEQGEVLTLSVLRATIVARHKMPMYIRRADYSPPATRCLCAYDGRL